MGGTFATAITESRDERDAKDITFKGVKISRKEFAELSHRLVAELSGLTHIEINDCRLKILTPEVQLFRASLEVLRLPNNLIDKLPAEFSQLALLTELDLSHNQFSKFPFAELAALPNLTTLDLKSNNLSTLPPISGTAASSDGQPGSLAQLAQLSHIDLSNNQFSEWPMGLCDLPALRSLDMNSNTLKRLPPEFARWMGGKLTSLQLRGNQLTQLPDEIGALKALVTLDLSENELLALPPRIGNLVNLQSLSLQHNHIRSLPPNIGTLTSLTSLKLHDNELEDLPDEISSLVWLTELFVQENRLRRLNPAVGKLVSLRKLFAEYNEINELPTELAELKRLVVLILHHNKLEELPLVLASLTTLLRLSLDENPIRDPQVKHVISTEGSLALIKRINAQDIPSVSLRTMRGLRRPALDDSRRQSSTASLYTSESRGSLNSPLLAGPTGKTLTRTISVQARPLRGEDLAKVTTLSDSVIPTRSRAGTATEVADGPSISSPISSALLGSPVASSSGASSSSSSKAAELVPTYSKFKGAFNSLLDEQDFSTKKKEILKKMSTEQKWNLLTQYKGSTLELLRKNNKTQKKTGSTIGGSTARTTNRTPQEYCSLIKQRRATKMELVTLRGVLGVQTQSWLTGFIECGGIPATVGYLQYIPTKFVKSSTDAGCVIELLGILKHFSELCLKQLLTTNQSVLSVVSNLVASTGFGETPILCLELLETFCNVPDIGPALTSEAFDKVHKSKPNLPAQQKYSRLVQLLYAPASPPTDPNVPVYTLDHRIMALIIISSIVDSQDDYEERFISRLHLQAEGLPAALKSLKEDPLATDLHLMTVARYEEDYTADYAEVTEISGKGGIFELYRRAGVHPGGDHSEDLVSVELCVAGHFSRRLLLKYTAASTAQDVLEEVVSKLAISASTIEDYGLYGQGQRIEATKLISVLPTEALLSLEFRPRVWRLYIDFASEVTRKEISKKDRHCKFDPSLPVGEVVSLICKKYGIEVDQPLCLYYRAKHGAHGSDSTSESEMSAPTSQTPIWLDDVKSLFEYGPQLYKRKNSRSYRLTVRLARIPMNIQLKDGQTHQVLLDPTLVISDVLNHLSDRFLPKGSALSRYGLFGLSEDPTLSSSASSSAASSSSSSSSSSDQQASSLAENPHVAGHWLDPTKTLNCYDFLTLRLSIQPQPIQVTIPGSDEPKTHTIDLSKEVWSIIAQVAQEEQLDSSTLSLFSATPNSRSDAQAVHMLLNPAVDLSRQVDIGSNFSLVLKPKSDDHDGSDPSILTNIWEEKPEKDVNVTYNVNKPDEIETATLNILIAHLTSIQDVDADFRRIFLLTYQFFTKPMILLTKLMERFCVPRDQFATTEEYTKCREIIQLRVLIFFKFWMQTHLKPETLAQIKQRVETWEADGADAIKQQLLSFIKAPRHEDHAARASQQPPKPKIPKGITDPTQISFFMLDDHEIARQLTLKVFGHFQKIKPTDLTLGGWAKPSTFHLCVNLMNVIQEFNHVAGWVATSLLRESRVRMRAKLYAKYIDVATLLLEFKNFHLLNAFISGLNSAAVSRLKFTLARVPKNSAAQLKKLEELMSMQSSFKTYRKMIADSMPPAIPYIGVYLTDLTFINDGNPDMLSHHRINFVKHRFVHNIIETIQKFQQDEYPFTNVPLIQQFLSKLEVMSEADQFRESLALEPRGADRADIK